MDNQKTLDGIRTAALDDVDKADKRVKRLLGLVAVVEAALLGTYLVVMDFGDRLHWLILVAAFLIYATLAVGMITASAYVNLSTQRILRAIKLASE